MEGEKHLDNQGDDAKYNMMSTAALQYLDTLPPEERKELLKNVEENGATKTGSPPEVEDDALGLFYGMHNDDMEL